MATNASFAVVGQGGSVLWGTTGIAMPTSVSAATTNFNDFGYLDEDGLTVSATPTISELNVWQSAQPVRRAFQSQAITLSGKFAEWNTNTVPRAFGGGTLAGLTNGTYAFPDPTTGLEEFAVVADVNDGSDKIRFAFARANQTEATEVQFNRQNLATLSFTIGVLAPQAGGSPGTIYTTNA